jgi:hypothetical protein
LVVSFPSLTPYSLCLCSVCVCVFLLICATDFWSSHFLDIQPERSVQLDLGGVRWMPTTASVLQVRTFHSHHPACLVYMLYAPPHREKGPQTTDRHMGRERRAEPRGYT